MNQQAVWGFDWDGVESATLEGPDVGQYLFQLADAKMDFNRKGKPYVNVGCKVIKVINGPEKAAGKVHWEYLSLEEERKGYTKNFFESIGAGNCLRPDRGPLDAVGTFFEADVIENNGYKNLRKIKAVDAAPGLAQNQGVEGSKESKEQQGDVGEGSKESEESEELTADIIMAMQGAELKDLAAEYEVSLTGLKTLKQKKEHLIAELIGLPSSAQNAGPRQAAVGAQR